MARFILSLDQGTTSSRSLLFDSDGSVVATSQEEFEQIFPEPGLVEHDGQAIWQSQLNTIRAVLNQSGVTTSDLAAIGITNQRETTLIWDRTSGQPIANAIVWQDRRTAAFCSELKKRPGVPEQVQEKTGLIIDPYFSGSKVRWLLDHVPGARERAEAGELAFGTVDSWLVWNLTGGRVHITDVTNASRTMLLNIHTLRWDDELLDLFNVPRSLLPEVRQSSEHYCDIDPEILGAAVPIGGIAGDQHAALFGQACLEPGMAKNTYGTGCFLLMNTGDQPIQSQHRLLSTIAWQIGGRVEYALEGSVFIAGALIQWLRDQLGIIASAPEVEALAASVDDSGGVYFVPAFAGLGAPHWDSYARGTLIGMTRGTNRAHIARAALEAIAFQSMELLEAMEKDSGIRLQELRVDGGASENSLLMQIQADLLQVPVVRASIAETTALGAAYLAGLATGFWSDRDEIRSRWKAAQSFIPSEQSEALREKVSDWQRAVERSKDWTTTS